MMRVKFSLISLCFLASLKVMAEAPISHIEVTPADQESLVLSILPFHEGDPFDPKLLEISKKLLAATDKFEQTELNWKAETDSLDVRVTPKLYFDDVNWMGSSFSEQDRVRQICMQPYEPRSISQERLSQVAQCFLREIRGRGYLDAQVFLEPKDANLQVELHLGPLYIIKALDFEGNEKLSSEELIEGLSNQVGKAFLAGKLDDDTKALLQTYFRDGFYFAEVFKPVLKVDPTNQSVQISWRVKESFPQDIKFTGHRKSRKLLYEYMERDQSFPTWFLDEIVDQMTTDLKEEGYLSADVRVLKSINERGVEEVDVHTRTGPRFDLVAPEWIGVGNRKEVLRVYEGISDFSTGSAFEENVYRSNLNEIFLPLLLSRGYLDARIRNLDFAIDRDRATVRPVIYLSEGERYLISRSSVEGMPRDYEKIQEEVDLKTSLRVGQPYDAIAIGKLAQDLQHSLIALAFLDAKVDKQIAKTPQGVEIKVVVTPGVRYKIAKVLIRGAIKTDYEVLKREVRLNPGEYYEDESVKDAISEILRLGIARSVDIQVLEKDPVKAEVYALVDVQEAARFRFEVGPGYGTLDGARGVFKATYANIGGTARQLSLYSKASRRFEDSHFLDRTLYTNLEEVPFIQRRISLEYFEPSFLNLPVDGRLNYTHAKEEHNRLGKQNSVAASLDYRLSRRWLFTTTYQLAFSDPFNILIKNMQPGDDAPKRFTSVGEIVLMDFTNDSFNPSKGFRTRLEGNLYDAHLGGEVNFWQTSVRQEYFQPLWVIRKGKTLGLALNLGAGFSESYGTTGDVPVEKRSDIGGENSVRGYSQGSVNPIRNGAAQEGGNSYFYFQSELNIPLFFGFDLLGFFDGGNAYLKNRDFHPWDLRFGAGPGVRWNTPVGPLKLGYGFAMFRKPGEPLGQLFIGVGAI